MACFKKLYSTKLENFQEMGKFLDVYDLPKLNKSEQNLKRFITMIEIKTLIKHSQLKKVHGQWVQHRIISALQRKTNSNTPQNIP